MALHPHFARCVAVYCVIFGDTDGDAHIVEDIVEATLALKADDVVELIAEVIALVSVENECLINDVAHLVTILIGGELGNIGYHSEAIVSVILADVNEIIGHFVESEVINEVFTQLIALYEGVVITEIAESTLAIDLEEVINAAASVVAVALPENAESINAIAKLATDLVGGELADMGYHDIEIIKDIFGKERMVWSRR